MNIDICMEKSILHTVLQRGVRLRAVYKVYKEVLNFTAFFLIDAALC